MSSDGIPWRSGSASFDEVGFSLVKRDIEVIMLALQRQGINLGNLSDDTLTSSDVANTVSSYFPVSIANGGTASTTVSAAQKVLHIFAPTTIDLFTSGSGTWSVPAGIVLAEITLVGGGGGYDSTGAVPGGGGGGIRVLLDLTGLSSVSYTVGAAGADGAGGADTSGGGSTISTTAITLSVRGGSRGSIGGQGGVPNANTMTHASILSAMAVPGQNAVKLAVGSVIGTAAFAAPDAALRGWGSAGGGATAGYVSIRY